MRARYSSRQLEARPLGGLGRDKWYLDSLWGHPQELLSAWSADIYRGDLWSSRDWILHCSPFNSNLTPTPFNSEPYLPNFVSSTWGCWLLGHGYKPEVHGNAPQRFCAPVLSCPHRHLAFFNVPPLTPRYVPHLGSSELRTGRNKRRSFLSLLWVFSWAPMWYLDSLLGHLQELLSAWPADI